MKQTENEERYCMNWGCDEKKAKYTYLQNFKKKELNKFNCWKHTGVFDFGHTGVGKVSEVVKNPMAGSLWKPHWSCCRGNWNVKGCTRCYHSGKSGTSCATRLLLAPCLACACKMGRGGRLWAARVACGPRLQLLRLGSNASTLLLAGPLLKNTDLSKIVRWPKIEAMKQFKKVGSALWKDKLQYYKILQPEEVEVIWNNYNKGQVISASELQPPIAGEARRK